MTQSDETYPYDDYCDYEANNEDLFDLCYIHPGRYLYGELIEHNMTQRDLAITIGKTPAVINGIIKGERDINCEIAYLLESVLPDSYSALEWMKMQCDYNLGKISFDEKMKEKRLSIENWLLIKKHLKISYLKKHLDITDNIERNLSLVFNALGVTSKEEFKSKINQLRQTACFKKSQKLSIDPVNLMSWIVIARHKSQCQALDTSFDLNQIENLKDELNQVITENKNTFTRVETICNKYGIKFIREKKLEKVPVDGYSFWVGKNPTIVMTGRMDRIDNFAFTLMHELGHIEKHLEADRNIDFMDIDTIVDSHKMNDKEQEANQYATDAIWKGENLNKIFSNIKNPLSASRYLKNIAISRHLNPGVVAGQYRHYCYVNELTKNAYAICPDLTEKIQ